MIHALPAMGTDRRIFPDPWSTLPGFIAHDWPRHRGERTLSEVARRVAEVYAIRDGDSIIGTSLGGMIACEVAKIRRLRRVFLVGSATHKTQISRMLTWLHPVAGIVPFRLLQIGARRLPNLPAQMFGAVEASFVRVMCAAIFRWDGLGDLTVPCVRIHGRRDWVIPPPTGVEHLLDGGHLIAISHARECAALVRGYLVGVEPAEV